MWMKGPDYIADEYRIWNVWERWMALLLMEKSFAFYANNFKKHSRPLLA